MNIVAPAETVLDVREAHVRHGQIHAVRDVAVEVRAGEIVGLIGPNGAGKTSLLRGIVGVGPCQASAIRLLGVDVRRLAPHRRARRGMVLVPEGRSLFSDLTVQQNLRVPQVARRSERAGSLEEVLTVFPLLRDRLGQRAGSLSGGQQQMLAIGRALVSSPRILLLDEVSLGLHPSVADTVYEALRGVLGSTGASALVVEQHVDRVLELTDRAYVMERGAVVAQGASSDLRRDIGRLRSLYLAEYRSSELSARHDTSPGRGAPEARRRFRERTA